MGDGRAEGSSAIGEGGQAAISLMPDVGGTHIYIFQSSKPEGSYVEDFLYDEWWQDMGLCLGGCYTSHQRYDQCAHFCWNSINYSSTKQIHFEASMVFTHNTSFFLHQSHSRMGWGGGI